MGTTAKAHTHEAKHMGKKKKTRKHKKGNTIRGNSGMEKELDYRHLIDRCFMYMERQWEGGFYILKSC